MKAPSLVPLRFGAHYGTGVVSKLIQWQQRTEVSHVSLIDNDNWLIEAREFRGVVRERTLADARRDIRVDEMVVMVSPLQRSTAIQWAMTQLGKSYDYASIARFITRSQDGRDDNGKWFCSEYTFVIAQKADVQLLKRIDPVNVSPGHFVISPLLTVASTN